VIVDSDVKAVAAHFGIDPALLQAVVQAEGNILRAVQCSMPSVQTREGALEVTARSSVHAMRDFIKTSGLEQAFVAFWGGRWAPMGASNDPSNLNRNWPSNVWTIWKG
jgi:hypothetical protein